MHSGKFLLYPLWLNKLIQVSYSIIISLKLIFVFNNVFCLIIVAICFKVHLSALLLFLMCQKNCSSHFTVKEFC